MKEIINLNKYLENKSAVYLIRLYDKKKEYYDLLSNLNQYSVVSEFVLDISIKDELAKRFLLMSLKK